MQKLVGKDVITNGEMKRLKDALLKRGFRAYLAGFMVGDVKDTGGVCRLAIRYNDPYASTQLLRVEGTAEFEVEVEVTHGDISAILKAMAEEGYPIEE